MTQEAIATAVGKDRATVANTIRLLKLPAEVQAEVAAGTLSMGHARALLSLPSEPEQLRVSRDVLARKLSVRETETLVKRAVEPPERGEPKGEGTNADVHTRAAEERLRLLLWHPRPHCPPGQPEVRIEIDFTSENELIRLFDQLAGDQ